MTKEELEKATGQELIDERNYCGADGYYGVYLDDVNAEMLKRFNQLADLEWQLQEVVKDNDHYQAENKRLEQQIEKMKCCGNCRFSESDTLNGTFCHREGCFVVASANCKRWEM